MTCLAAQPPRPAVGQLRSEVSTGAMGSCLPRRMTVWHCGRGQVTSSFSAEIMSWSWASMELVDRISRLCALTLAAFLFTLPSKTFFSYPRNSMKMLKGQKEREREKHSEHSCSPGWLTFHSEAVTEFKQASLETHICMQDGGWGGRAWQFRSCWPIFILLKLGLIVGTVDLYATGFFLKKNVIRFSISCPKTEYDRSF